MATGGAAGCRVENAARLFASSALGKLRVFQYYFGIGHYRATTSPYPLDALAERIIVAEGEAHGGRRLPVLTRIRDAARAEVRKAPKHDATAAVEEGETVRAGEL